MATFAHFSHDPAELLRLADTALRQSGPAGLSFVTAVCLTIGPAPDRELWWAAAGHPAPWSLDTGASLATGTASAPLGVGPGTVRRPVARVPLGSGVLLFTDGLTEGRPAHRRPGTPVSLFGNGRARSVVQEHRDDSAEDVVAALVSAVTGFAGGTLADDL
jgi:serine phosphatase RsbU (regulator of sigma subunit)